MSNVLDDEKQQQILALGPLGWTRPSDRRGDRRGRATVTRLPAGGRHPGARPRTAKRRDGKTGHFAEVSTDSLASNPAISRGGVHRLGAPAPTRAPSASACEPYRELIAAALGRGRNAVAIWQDLVDDHGFTAKYASVRRFVVKLRGTAPAEARVVITTAPGEEGQVDYGEGPMVRDPAPASTAARASSC